MTHSSNCPRILLCGTDDCHTRHLGPAVLHTLEHLPCHTLDVTSLFEETLKAAEEAIIQVTCIIKKLIFPTIFTAKYYRLTHRALNILIIHILFRNLKAVVVGCSNSYQVYSLY